MGHFLLPDKLNFLMALKSNSRLITLKAVCAATGMHIVVQSSIEQADFAPDRV
jgi:hypothetical protein